MEIMKKDEFMESFIENLTKEGFTPLSRKEANAYFNALVATIAESLKSGKFEGIKLLGLGTFIIKDMKERGGVNPSSGEKIVIPAHKKLTFKVSKTFNTELNGKE